MEIKDKIKENENYSNKTAFKRFGIFNVDGVNGGVARGNKLAMFNNENETKEFCIFILSHLKNEESLKKIIVVDFESGEEKSILLYSFENLINSKD